jgi:hypothetical protein
MVNDASFILDPSKGGMNWGYCVDEDKIPPMDYLAIVETSDIPGSQTK